MRERCDHCKKWIKDGDIVSTLEGLVSEGVDFSFAICEKCGAKPYIPNYWDKWVAKVNGSQ
jgi:hypothetical protein